MNALTILAPRAARLAAILVLVAGCSPATGTLGTVPPAPSADASVVQSAEPTAPPSASGTAEPANSATPGATATPTQVPTARPTEPAGSASPSPAATTVVRAYFLRPNAASGPLAYDLVPVLRSVPATKAVARAAVTQLLAGPTERGLVSAIPAGTSLLGISIDGSTNVATVDLSSRFGSGGTSASQIARAAEVVYTLTQFGNVDGVVFQMEGAPLAVPDDAGRTHVDAVDRSDYRALLPPIWVDRPAYAASIGNPARVAGLANVFEATFRVRIADGSGRVLADQQAMATCGTGCWGTWDATIPYTVTTGQWGTLRVYDLSARDGSPENVREEPVWLSPGG